MGVASDTCLARIVRPYLVQASRYLTPRHPVTPTSSQHCFRRSSPIRSGKFPQEAPMTLEEQAEGAVEHLHWMFEHLDRVKTEAAEA